MVIGLVIAVLVAMGPYIGYSTKGVIRLVADEIGVQNQADQKYNDASAGYLRYSYSTQDVRTSKERNERLGVINYVFDDVIRGTLNQSTNMGIRYTN